MHKQETSMLRRFFPPKAVSYVDPETSYYNPFPNFAFTGPLRPVYPLSPRREVPKSIPHPDYAEDGIPKYNRSVVRSNKIEQLDAKAQDGMRKVCRLAREVLDIAAAAVRPGITTDEIDEIVHKACIERNVSYSRMSSARTSTLINTVLPITPKLQSFPQVGMHLSKRGDLPRYPRQPSSP